MSRIIDPRVQHAGRPALMAKLAQKAVDAQIEEAEYKAWLNRDTDAIRKAQRKGRRAAVKNARKADAA